MHEMAVTQSLVKRLEEIARQNHATNVKSVTLQLGPLSGFVAESVQFCYEVLSKEGLLAGSVLQIENEDVCLQCAICQKQSTPPDIFNLYCAHCQSRQVDVVKGKSFLIKSMEVD